MVDHVTEAMAEPILGQMEKHQIRLAKIEAESKRGLLNLDYITRVQGDTARARLAKLEVRVAELESTVQRLSGILIATLSGKAHQVTIHNTFLQPTTHR